MAGIGSTIAAVQEFKRLTPPGVLAATIGGCCCADDGTEISAVLDDAMRSQSFVWQSVASADPTASTSEEPREERTERRGGGADGPAAASKSAPSRSSPKANAAPSAPQWPSGKPTTSERAPAEHAVLAARRGGQLPPLGATARHAGSANASVANMGPQGSGGTSGTRQSTEPSERVAGGRLSGAMAFVGRWRTAWRRAWVSPRVAPVLGNEELVGVVPSS